ncbi:uncharacterized protein LOC129719996 [Wyeomyia smithii]|uniref:uncharacterized protein LOC129719996 n=1 Tax=Wyeomyia smithii TaxID=174621 RepID=UPI002467CF0D|nr:uncharacterized protein LOC129719996 [Wyeomyia smithii]
MNSECYQCSQPIKTLEYMQCNGFCNQAVHLKCTGFKRPNMELVNSNHNLLWFCDNCIEHLKQFKETPTPMAHDIVAAVSENISDSLSALKSELLETKALTKALIDKTTNDVCDPNRARSAWPSVKRPRDVALRETPKSRTTTKLACGTKPVEKLSKTVATVEKAPEKFWLYLSRIACHVTEEDISELVKSCLSTELTVDVKKLVRKDADLKQLAFISFKIGIDTRLKETALDPASWPKGIYFREFEHLQSSRDFWGPTKILRIDGATPSRIVSSPKILATPID